MQVSGKCKIANKWVDRKLDKDQFDFDNKGSFSVGKLTWSDSVKDKSGNQSFVYSTKKFICFGANGDFIESNLSNYIDIVGNIKTESFTNKEGEVIKYDLIVINEVKLSEKKEFLKKEVKQQAIDIELDDSCPF
jgi:hypothetical protein